MRALGRIARALPGLEALLRWQRSRELRRWRAAFAGGSDAAAVPLDVEIQVRPPCGEAWQASLAAVSPRLRLAGDAGPGTYEYAPTSREGALAPDHLASAVLALAFQPLDFLVVSWGSIPPPGLRIAGPGDNVVVSAHAASVLRETGRLPAGACGRVVRLLPPPAGAPLRDVGPEALQLGPLEARGPLLSAGAPAPRAARRPVAPLLAPRAERPILVLPGALAVGGAERNLVALLGAASGRYSFVVVPTEPIAACGATLHHQVAECCDALLDLGELAPQTEHLRMLSWLARELRPRLVWICNGSRWLVANADALRRCFADVPIVAQQVYDDREGWIQYHHDPGLRSFDRYVALSGRVRRALERSGVDAERIDEIPHAIDTKRFSLARADALPRVDRVARLGLPAGRPLIGMIARLVEQKQPLRFLDLARRARDAGLAAGFVLVGDGPLAERCDAYCAQHGLAVLRIAHCEDVSELLPALDGLVLTSRYEGLPIVLLEALAMGVPALTPDVGAVRVLAEETGCVQVVDRSSEGAALLRSFERFVSGLDALRSRARAAAPGIAQRFGASAVFAETEACWSRAWQARRG